MSLCAHTCILSRLNPLFASLQLPFFKNSAEDALISMPWRTALLHPTSIWHLVVYPLPSCQSHLFLLSALQSSDKNIIDIQMAITCVLFSKQSFIAQFSRFENQKVVFSKIKWKIFFPAASKKLKALASVCQSSIINKQPGRKQSDLQKTLSVLINDLEWEQLDYFPTLL